jgi:hypothetical protein
MGVPWRSAAKEKAVIYRQLVGMIADVLCVKSLALSVSGVSLTDDSWCVS